MSEYLLYGTFFFILLVLLVWAIRPSASSPQSLMKTQMAAYMEQVKPYPSREELDRLLIQPPLLNSSENTGQTYPYLYHITVISQDGQVKEFSYLTQSQAVVKAFQYLMIGGSITILHEKSWQDFERRVLSSSSMVQPLTDTAKTSTTSTTESS